MKFRKRVFVTGLFFTFIPLMMLLRLFGQDSQKNNADSHPELGDVKWHRNFEQAQALAKRAGKPMLVLFQEVPGCAGCKAYGQEVLRHPLLVEAMEDLFVPIVVFNNRGGKDRDLLERFNEPAWNYQVIRYLDENGEDLIVRKDRIWTIEATANRMIQALQVTGKPIPEYLRGLVAGSQKHVKTAAFAMYCFWEGEARLGQLDGVLSTESGWMEGREVVRVKYDASVLHWNDLAKAAIAMDCAHRIYAPDPVTAKETKPSKEVAIAQYDPGKYRKAKSSDQEKSLQQTALRNLELTELQSTKINAALRLGKSTGWTRWLSPRQLEALKRH